MEIRKNVGTYGSSEVFEVLENPITNVSQEKFVRKYSISPLDLYLIVQVIRAGIQQVYRKNTVFDAEILQRWVYLDSNLNLNCSS